MQIIFDCIFSILRVRRVCFDWDQSKCWTAMIVRSKLVFEKTTVYSNHFHIKDCTWNMKFLDPRMSATMDALDIVFWSAKGTCFKKLHLVCDV